MKDSVASIWGLRVEKLRPLQTLPLDEVTNEWQSVPPGVVVPGGVEVRMDLGTGAKFARRLALADDADAQQRRADSDARTASEL